MIIVYENWGFQAAIDAIYEAEYVMTDVTGDFKQAQ